MDWKRHVPHRTRSGSKICVPPAWAFFFGGTYESAARHGGGYSWRPSLWRMLRRYYGEGWRSNGYTLTRWLRIH